MKKIPLKEMVYQTLRSEILSGDIPGGSHITESVISRRLDVSRTPVREALQRLTQEKLITALPRAGYIIEDMSDEDIQDIFTARFEIEAIVAKKAAQFITPQELEQLAANIEQARAHIQTGTYGKITRLDIEFHSIIYRAARSKTYYRICKNLGDLTMKYRHGLNLAEHLWDRAMENHQTIYQALASKDETRAVEAVQAHGAQAVEQLMQLLKQVRTQKFVSDELW